MDGRETLGGRGGTSVADKLLCEVLFPIVAIGLGGSFRGDRTSRLGEGSNLRVGRGGTCGMLLLTAVGAFVERDGLAGTIGADMMLDEEINQRRRSLKV